MSAGLEQEEGREPARVFRSRACRGAAAGREDAAGQRWGRGRGAGRLRVWPAVPSGPSSSGPSPGGARGRSLPASRKSSCSAFKSLLEAPATVFPENQPVFCAVRFSVFLATLIATRGTGLFTHRFFPAGWGAPLGQSPCPIRLFSLVVAQSQAHSKHVNSCGRNKRMQ